MQLCNHVRRQPAICLSDILGLCRVFVLEDRLPGVPRPLDRCPLVDVIGRPRRVVPKLLIQHLPLVSVVRPVVDLVHDQCPDVD